MNKLNPSTTCEHHSEFIASLMEVTSCPRNWTLVREYYLKRAEIAGALFLRFHDYFKRFDKLRNLPSPKFHSRIARFAAIDYLRKNSFFPAAERKRQQALSQTGRATPCQYFEGTLHDAETETPESLYERKQLKLRVRQALERLPHDERDLLWHLYFEDKPLKAFCEQSNSSGYVSKLHKKALRSLRSNLQALANRDYPIFDKHSDKDWNFFY